MFECILPVQKAQLVAIAADDRVLRDQFMLPVRLPPRIVDIGGDERQQHRAFELIEHGPLAVAFSPQPLEGFFDGGLAIELSNCAHHLLYQ